MQMLVSNWIFNVLPTTEVASAREETLRRKTFVVVEILTKFIKTGAG